MNMSSVPMLTRIIFHNHIIFNATSFVDHHKYVSNKRSYHKICRISNRICQENGLATRCQPAKKGNLIKKIWNTIVETAGKQEVKVARPTESDLVPSINYDEFLQKMKLAGYEIRQERTWLSGHRSKKTLQI